MVTLQISEELDAELQQAAERLGCTKNEFLRDAVIARVEEQFATEADLTEEQIARMKHSIAQLDRGEVVTSEQIDKKFEDWRTQRASR
jgi:predicted transcriptional regulator